MALDAVFRLRERPNSATSSFPGLQHWRRKWYTFSLGNRDAINPSPFEPYALTVYLWICSADRCFPVFRVEQVQYSFRLSLGCEDRAQQ